MNSCRMNIRITVRSVKRVETCYCATPALFRFTCGVLILRLMNRHKAAGVALSV